MQNSLDARRVDAEPVSILFRLVELSGFDLDRFKESMDWNSLADNLEAVPDKRGGRAIQQAMELIESRQVLQLLVIEDRGTKGLEGSEQRASDDETNSFCALVRDELYSDKTAEDAGGSFGLGKSVLWAYSGLKTVLFASVPASPPPGKQGVRLVGRASLPYHETDEDGPCNGDGWLGIVRGSTPSDRRAESVWGSEAARVAESCSSARDANDCGLSLVVVAFSEPGEEDRAASDVAGSIVEAALESFWPAVVRESLEIAVRSERNGQVLDERTADPFSHDSYRPAAELLRDFDSGLVSQRDSLEIGQSSYRTVDIEVPQRIESPAHAAFTGTVTVLVTLLDEASAAEEIRDRIFRFRRPGMVVRSTGGRHLSIGARPYVAAAIAGRADGGTEEHDRVERFLRAAEPPAHDRWIHNTRTIKQEYSVYGCKAKLDRFEQNLLKAIRDLVSKPEEHGGALPPALLRHLRFGDRGGGGNPRFLSVTQQSARVQDGRWTFQARCRRIRPDADPWHVRVRLKYAVDGGGSDDVHAICEIRADDATRVDTRNGVGFVEFPATVTAATIRGETDSGSLPSIGTRSAIQLRIDGAKGALTDA